ncbi:unnamed protein product [Durusdinium trenchii]|uniref:Lipase (Triacylglycerol lipase) n=2 Tax=Durusdinium trenchii TaxID=1381693 RepID=A0ABP0KWJ7_9DINO
MAPFVYQSVPPHEGEVRTSTEEVWLLRRPCTALAPAAVVAAAAFLCIFLAGSPISSTESPPPEAIARMEGISKEFSIFQLSMSTYERMFGDTDPFQFKCPVPGVLAEGSNIHSCCGGYNTLGWPFQFSECRPLGYCTTCWVESSQEEMQKHEGIEFAGAAWAATISVMNKADRIRSAWGSLWEGRVNRSFRGPTVDDMHVADRRMHAVLRTGLVEGQTNVCPAIDDWDIDMLNEDRENIHARVYKSAHAKLAIVAFRGTQFESMKNWHVDADIQRIPMKLPNGNVTFVHEGFLNALNHVLPHVKRWVDGYILGLFSAVPSDWNLIFTGHSLGGALALLAATKAFAEDWPRKPEATIAFGVPRVADAALDDWWQAQQLCGKLIRVNTYNDVVHVMPFHKMWSAWTAVSDVYDCVTSPLNCLSPSANLGSDASQVEISNQWAHVCPQSEILIPSRVKGINQQLEEMSPFGGVLAHLNENCLYGYIYAVLHSNITSLDRYCNLSPDVCNVSHVGIES